jgi:phospholipid/cholesterol/gamma-HCH transport system permease protein
VNLEDFTRKTSVLLGDFTLFVIDTLKTLSTLWRRRGIFLKQCEFIGVTSLGVITVAGMFLGAVLGYQLYVSFHKFGAEALLGGSVGVALFRELGPVMAAVMVIGRAGAAMAAELASMRISEQIDALEVMAIDPIEFLVTPRVVAGVLMMPILGAWFSVVGTFSASLVGCGVMGLDTTVFWNNFEYLVDPIDIYHCVVKAATFGLVLTWIGCYCGFKAYGGARAVGLATRNTVVAATLTVLLSDYVLTSTLPFGLSKLKVL